MFRQKQYYYCVTAEIVLVSGAVDVNRQSDRSGIKKPNKEEKGSSLELEPETPRTFSVVNNRSELASIDASSSASSMKNFTGDRACGPGVVLNNKKIFQYRSGGCLRACVHVCVRANVPSFLFDSFLSPTDESIWTCCMKNTGFELEKLRSFPIDALTED